MTRDGYDVLRDPELVDLFCDEPELLAIADAFAATQSQLLESRRHRRRIRRIAPLVVVVAAVCALVLLAPWRQDGNPFLGRALAAIGQDNVVHALVRARDPLDSVVDLTTGKTTPRLIENELWFDQQNDRLHVITRRGGQVIADTITTRAGGSSTQGPVATRRGEPVSIDPALAGFISGYRNALITGQARVVASRQLAGVVTNLIEFAARGSAHEQVAVDTATGLPRAFWMLSPSGRVLQPEWRIASISSAPLEATDFATPQAATLPTRGGTVISVRPISVAAAADALQHQRSLWAGTRIAHLNLGAIQLQQLSASHQRGETHRSPGLALLYGTIGPPARASQQQPYIEILEATGPEQAYAYAANGLSFNWYPLPPGGQLDLTQLRRPTGPPLWLGQLRHGHLYLTIEASSKALLLAAARALTPIGPN